MNRAQRHAHRQVWRILGPLLLLLVIVALARRPAAPVQVAVPAAPAVAR